MRKKYISVISLIVLIGLVGCGFSLDQNTQSDMESYITLADAGDQKQEKERIEQDSKKTTDSYIQLMPNVTIDMLSADFWIEKIKDKNKIIMTEDEIQKFNDSIMIENAVRRKYLYYSSSNGERVISKEDLKELLDESEIPEKTYYRDNTAVNDSYWRKLVVQENYEGIKDENILSYGFAVKRASMRLFPTNDILSEDETFTFYDEMQISLLLIGEPVIISHTSKDGTWKYVITNSCYGWVPSDAIAYSSDYDSWKQESESEQFLIVTDDEMRLEYDPVDRDISEIELTMGTKLPLVPIQEYNKNLEGREAYGNFVVKIPVRKKDGSLSWHYAFVPVSRGVSIGYLEYTQENVLKLACKALGNRYGWGGMYNSRDCSLYIMEIYRCFGILLPRNSTGLSEMNCETVNVGGYGDADKEEQLEFIPAGSVLYMKGHVALYLGTDQSNFYVISASAAPILDGTDTKVNVQSVIINDLKAKRPNGKTWMSNLEKYKIIR